MIVDTSVLIAILRREPDATALSRRLLTERPWRASVGTLIEARMVALRDDGLEELNRLTEKFDLEVVSVDVAQAVIAVQGFQRFGKGRHPAGLNLGDLFAYGLAKALDEPLLLKGNDFSQTDVKQA